MMTLEKTLYTASTTVTGGRRDGKATSADGQLSVTLNMPPEMGGKGDGVNPEQLFGAGYAACFLGAMQFIAAQRKTTLSPQTTLRAEVGVGPQANGVPGFGLTMKMHVHIPGMDLAAAKDLVAAAHQVCPYSSATRGNLDVQFAVV